MPLSQAIGEFLAFSEAREEWWERVVESEWRAGYRVGVEAGRAQVLKEEAAARRAAARLTRPGPTQDEMDRKRYPPDGRLSWLLPGNGGAA